MKIALRLAIAMLILIGSSATKVYADGDPYPCPAGQKCAPGFVNTDKR